MRTALASLALALAAFLAGACSKGAGADNAPPPTTTNNVATPSADDATAQAEEIFKNRCTPCHGPEGRGNGPASATLTPKPRNFHDKKWHASVDDAHIEQIIQYGGAAVGKSPSMPANPDLQSKPDVVKALRAKIRNFGTID